MAISYLLLVISIRIFVGYIYRNQLGHPSFLIPFFLEVLLVYPVVVVDALNLQWSVAGVFLLYLCVFCTQLGLLVLPRQRQIYRSGRGVVVRESILTFVYLILVGTYATGIFIQYRQGGGEGIPSISQLFEYANRAATSRYAGDLQISVYYKVGVIAAFAGAVISGYSFPKAHGRRKLFLISGFLIALIDSALMAARAGLLLQTVVWGAAYYLGLIRAKGIGLNFDLKKLFAASGFVGVSIFLLFLIIQILRSGDVNIDPYPIASYILTWFFGYIPAFSIWAASWSEGDYSLGAITFAGFFNFLGIVKREQGIFDPVAIGDGRVSNVFTAARGIFEDFGLIGGSSLLILVALGAGLLFRYVNRGWLVQSALLLYLAFIGWFFVVSCFTYNSLILGVVIGCFLAQKIGVAR